MLQKRIYGFTVLNTRLEGRKALFYELKSRENINNLVVCICKSEHCETRGEIHSGVTFRVEYLVGRVRNKN